MEEIANIKDIINNIIYDEKNYNVLIIDNKTYKNRDKNIILEKAKKLGFSVIDESIGLKIKIIETCYEIIKIEADSLNSSKPHRLNVVLKEDVESFKYEEGLIDVLDQISIIKELYNKFLNLKDGQNKNFFILSTTTHTCKLNDDIYISLSDFLNLEEVGSVTPNSKAFILDNECNETALIDILPTFVEIMNKKINTRLIKESNNSYIIKMKNYSLKVFLMHTYTELEENHEVISSYDLAIDDFNDEHEMRSVLDDQAINALYEKIKEVGVNFRK